MNKTVLIVEDNELNMKLFRDLLEAHGFETLQTKNGEEALQLARDHHPDLIIMDIQLPEVSGLEVTRWIKDDDDIKSIPIVAVTAFAMKGDEEKIREGADSARPASHRQRCRRGPGAFHGRFRRLSRQPRSLFHLGIVPA